MLNKMDKYIDNVCNQIRYKKVHKFIKKELENHIVDQKNVFIQQGLDEQTALNKAIEEMGDPILVGNQFNTIHRPKPEWSIIFFTAIMVITSFIINILIFKDKNLINSTVIFKLFMSIILGTVLLVAIYFVDYTIIAKYSKTLLIVFTVIGFVLKATYPATRTFACILILAIPLYAASVYSLKDKKYIGIIESAFICLFVTVMFFCSYPSYAILFFICCIVILTLLILKGWFDIKKRIFTVVCEFLAVFVPLFFAFRNSPYILRRISIWLNPYEHALEEGYQSVIIREVIEHSKFIGNFEPFEFFGQTVNSQNLTSFVPDIENLIITYLTAKFGLIAEIFLIGIIIFLIVRIKVCFNRQKNSLGFIMSFACILAIVVQTISYISFNIGFYMVSSGFPLISSGVNLIVNMGLIGILLSIFKNNNLTIDEFKTKQVI